MQIERSKGKLDCLYCRDAALDDEIAQIERRTQACLSMTEMQTMTRSVNTLGIDAFGIRFGASGLDSERVRYRDVLLTVCCGVTLFHPHPCGADLKVCSTKPNVPWRETASGHKNGFLEVPISFQRCPNIQGAVIHE